MTTAAPPAPGLGAPSLSNSYRNYAMAMLLMMYILNFFDRQVINILAEPIKEDLGLSDTQLGWMAGPAFAFLYTILGIPIARFAEHANRPAIMAASLAVWSGFTALCGTAQNFWQLFLFRVGVGVGEAGGTPPAHSLIVDYYPKEKRASALAFYSMGVPLGSFFGFAVGGVISDLFDWRWAFAVAGLPGVAMAVVVILTLKETRSKLKVDAAARKADRPPFMNVLRLLFTKKTFWLIAVAASLKAFIGYGHSPFTASIFVRQHGEELNALGGLIGLEAVGFMGVAIGISVGIFGASSSFLGGKVADAAGKIDYGKTMIFPAIASLICMFAYAAAVNMPSAKLGIAFLIVNYIFSYVWYGPVYATTQGIVSPAMRATTAAILLFIINMIGLGLGPLAVGFVSDLFANMQLQQIGLDVATCKTAARGSELAISCAPSVAEGLRWSLTLSTLIGIPAFVLFWMAVKTTKRDIES